MLLAGRTKPFEPFLNTVQRMVEFHGHKCVPSMRFYLRDGSALYRLYQRCVLILRDGEWLPGSAGTHPATGFSSEENLIGNVKRWEHAAGTKIRDVVNKCEQRACLRRIFFLAEVLVPCVRNLSKVSQLRHALEIIALLLHWRNISISLINVVPADQLTDFVLWSGPELRSGLASASFMHHLLRPTQECCDESPIRSNHLGDPQKLSEAECRTSKIVRHCIVVDVKSAYRSELPEKAKRQKLR